MEPLTYLLNNVDPALIISIIVIIEVVKQGLKRALQWETPSWVWKVAVIVAAVVAGLFTDTFSVSTVFHYAAASTFIYQTVKMAVKPVVDKFVKEEE